MEGAFQAAVEKSSNKDKATRIAPNVTQTSDKLDGVVNVGLKLADIAKAKPATSEKGTIGFMLEPIEFKVDGQKFVLKPGWVSLVAAIR